MSSLEDLENRMQDAADWKRSVRIALMDGDVDILRDVARKRKINGHELGDLGEMGVTNLLFSMGEMVDRQLDFVQEDEVMQILIKKIGWQEIQKMTSEQLHEATIQLQSEKSLPEDFDFQKWYSSIPDTHF